jgi:8-oxo-dGTP pyrophosphatase MutT (NUDIX family)
MVKDDRKRAKDVGLPIAEQAGGIVVMNDQIVLRLTKGGHLVFPKGHIEPGETPEQTAVREIMEETGLITEPVGVAGSIRFKKGHTVRRVTYYLMRTIRENHDYGEHLGRDTFPVPLDWARHLLTFDNTRKLLEGAQPQIERMVMTAER